MSTKNISRLVGGIQKCGFSKGDAMQILSDTAILYSEHMKDILEDPNSRVSSGANRTLKIESGNIRLTLSPVGNRILGNTSDAAHGALKLVG